MQSSLIKFYPNQVLNCLKMRNQLYAEYWARSVQRGYRFPGVAASIRNSLAMNSLLRIKTNSLGESNINQVKAGRYFLVGASTLGQVGVVWSKPVELVDGKNEIALGLRDAAWAE